MFRKTGDSSESNNDHTTKRTPEIIMLDLDDDDEVSENGDNDDGTNEKSEMNGTRAICKDSKQEEMVLDSSDDSTTVSEECTTSSSSSVSSIVSSVSSSVSSSSSSVVELNSSSSASSRSSRSSRRRRSNSSSSSSSSGRVEVCSVVQTTRNASVEQAGTTENTSTNSTNATSITAHNSNVSQAAAKSTNPVTSEKSSVSKSIHHNRISVSKKPEETRQSQSTNTSSPSIHSKSRPLANMSATSPSPPPPPPTTTTTTTTNQSTHSLLQRRRSPRFSKGFNPNNPSSSSKNNNKTTNHEETSITEIKRNISPSHRLNNPISTCASQDTTSSNTHNNMHNSAVIQVNKEEHENNTIQRIYHPKTLDKRDLDDGKKKESNINKNSNQIQFDEEKKDDEVISQKKQTTPSTQILNMSSQSRKSLCQNLVNKDSMDLIQDNGKSHSQPIVLCDDYCNVDNQTDHDDSAGASSLSKSSNVVLHSKDDGTNILELMKSNPSTILKNVTLSPVLSDIANRPCCWTCSAPLRYVNYQPTTYDFSYDDYPIYVMHQHPISACSALPLCCFCYENCDIVEQLRHDSNAPLNQTSQSMDDESHQSNHKNKSLHAIESVDDDLLYCSGCGLEEHPDVILFLCDNDVLAQNCGRAFCQNCVCKSHGGDKIGHAKVRELRDSSERWHCPVCDPPIQFQKLLEVLKLNIEKINAEHVESSKSSKPRRSIDVVMKDFDVAEKELYDCQKQLELFEMNELDFSDMLETSLSGDKDYQLTQQVQLKRSEIREELILNLQNSGRDLTDLEEELRTEIQLLCIGLKRHEVNVSNFISFLQEEVQNDHNVALESIYSDGLGILTHKKRKKRKRTTATSSAMSTTDNSSSEDDNDEEPDYVRIASKTINRRYKSEGLSTFDVLDPSVYLREDYDQIDDLSTLLIDSEDHEYEGWTYAKTRPTAMQIEEAIKSEEAKLALLRRRNRCCITAINENQDEDENRFEQEQEEKMGKPLQHLKENLDTRRQQPVIVQEPRVRRSQVQRQHNDVATSKPPHPTALPALLPYAKSPSRATSRWNASASIFLDSKIILCEENEKSTPTTVRTVAIAKPFEEHLKQHQINGIKFIWRNCFSDFANHMDGNEGLIGGCILAHHMGLGKSLTTIALLHAVARHPSMFGTSTTENSDRLITRVLLVVPVNTIANWEAEFDKWLRDVDPLLVYNLSTCDRTARLNTISRWQRGGGVLIVSDATLLKLFAKKCFHGKTLQPHVLVVDEAHTMLKTSTTKTFQALSKILTKRKIALTGSPFQNNLMEYFRMINFVRPNVLEFQDESTFQRTYQDCIEKGMASDAQPYLRFMSLSKSKELSEKVRPFVDRVDESELRHVLPLMQDITLHIRQSKLQIYLYQQYDRLKKKNDMFNHFFRQYHSLYPVHNHPGGLLLSDDKWVSKDDSGKPDPRWIPQWGKYDRDKVLDPENGFKIVLLLHILSYAQKLNEKVLVFSNCIKTLNYIEYVLALEDWRDYIPSLNIPMFKGLHLGGWRKSFEYLRIDGEIHSVERGDLINQFNAADVIGSESTVRVFLLSSRAGGIGINLTAASRVVMMDNNFNPTIATQAVCRAYRYGQTKPVFCYRFLTERTMEEKIFSRCVNKIGIGLQVIDQKTINRHFSARELQNLMAIDLWVQCDACNKWRMLIGTTDDDLPDKWYCNLNIMDPQNNSCDKSEKDKEWYDMHYFGGDPSGCSTVDTSHPKKKGTLAQSKAVPHKVAVPDEILEHLLKVHPATSKVPLVKKHVFQDTLLHSRDDNEELESARKAWLQEKAIANETATAPIDASQSTVRYNIDNNSISQNTSTAHVRQMLPPSLSVSSSKKQSNYVLPKTVQDLPTSKIHETPISQKSINKQHPNNSNSCRPPNAQSDLPIRKQWKELCLNSLVITKQSTVSHKGNDSSRQTQTKEQIGGMVQTNNLTPTTHKINELPHPKKRRTRSAKSCLTSYKKPQNREGLTDNVSNSPTNREGSGQSGITNATVAITQTSCNLNSRVDVTTNEKSHGSKYDNVKNKSTMVSDSSQIKNRKIEDNNSQNAIPQMTKSTHCIKKVSNCFQNNSKQEKHIIIDLCNDSD